MVLNIKYFFVKIILICCAHFVNAVPPDYCLQALNTSDCNGPPTPVFYYYKPGSRCELGIWKGCPTNNKFDDEYLCSHFCIFRFIKGVAESENLIDYTDQCSKTIKENTCKDNNNNVAYTFSDEHQECIPIVWGDCKSPNVFKEKQSCIDTCFINWQDEIKNLTADEVKQIDELLDNVTSNATNNDTGKDGKKQLKLLDDETTAIDVTISDKPVSDTQNSSDVAEAPITEKATSINSATENAATEKPASEKPETEKPATEKPATESPTTDEPATESPPQKSTSHPRSRGTVKGVVLYDEIEER